MSAKAKYKINEAINELKKLAIPTPIKPVPPSDELIKKYENKIGIKFSTEYKKFLQEASMLFVGTISPLVLTEEGNAYNELSEKLEDARSLGVPRSWLPIYEDNGDYYCLLENGEIKFWSQYGCKSCSR